MNAHPYDMLPAEYDVTHRFREVGWNSLLDQAEREPLDVVSSDSSEQPRPELGVPEGESGSLGSDKGLRLRSAAAPVLEEAALYGVAGDIVRRLSPHTEADRAALLVQLLVGLGNLFGRAPSILCGGIPHFCNEFAIIVGPTNAGRKGTGLQIVKSLVLARVDDDWLKWRNVSGLSSGEGLIHAVRDASAEDSDDHGVTDKRLFVFEAELASSLKRMSREGNTLSAQVREFFDSGDVQVLTKNSPERATGAHVSIIGHITPLEVRRVLTGTDLVNGFANRFLWVWSERNQELPHGDSLVSVDLSAYTQELREVRDRVAGWGGKREIDLDDEARQLWEAEYSRLSQDVPSLVGQIASRGAAHVRRLALIYAVLDAARQQAGPVTIRRPHLEAALAVWRYCERTVRYVFGPLIGNAAAGRILKALNERWPEGITRSGLSDLFGRNQDARALNEALELLRQEGLAMSEKRSTGGKGRPAEVWTFVKPTRKTKETNE